MSVVNIPTIVQLQQEIDQLRQDIQSVNGSLINLKNVVHTLNASSLRASSLSLTTTSTTYVPIAGTALATLILTEPTQIIFYIMGQGYMSSLFHDSASEDQIDLTFYETNTNTPFVNVLPYGLPVTVTASGNQWYYPELQARSTVRLLQAGTYNYSLYWAVNGTGASNGGTASLFTYDFGYIVL